MSNWNEENRRKVKIAEKANDEKMMAPVREAGKAAVTGMEEGRMDAMGNAYKKGGSVSSASKRADGCAIRGKTRA